VVVVLVVVVGELCAQQIPERPTLSTTIARVFIDAELEEFSTG
jgi:hypothetical protein